MAVPPVIDISSSPATDTKDANASHRLATVSASQALHDLQGSRDSHLSTSLRSLDSRLSASSSANDGGIERGKITEIWGPAGSGKTALALQTAACVVKAGNDAVWIDCVSRLSSTRFQTVVAESIGNERHVKLDQMISSLKQRSAPTLSHLMALILQPPTELVSGHIALLVVDDLNHLVDLDYPRQPFASVAKTEQQKWQSSRRYGVLGSLASALNKLAVLKKIAIVVTNGSSTRMRHDSGLGAALAPGIGGVEWEAGIWNRLVMFRDFAGRFIGIQKVQGRSQISREEIGETGHVVPFDISPDGMIQERRPGKHDDGAAAALAKARISPVKPRKRAFDEIADSDGEEVDEYGWAEADDDAITAEGLIYDGGTVASTVVNGK